MKILFMGTPDYAAKTLGRIIEAGHEVCGVFAQPDKPVGRKRILTPPPVKQLALSKGLNVYQPESLKNSDAVEIIKGLNPELIVVVAYGKILPEEILSIAKYGCINGHASILPKYRGASPIQWAIICGEEKTGITIQYMDKGIDTGDIISIREVDIKPTETADELFDRLAVVSADLMVETIEKIADGTAKRTKQNEEDASYAPIIKKEMALIDFTKTATEVYNAIRGYYSWPCAFFFLNGKRIKVTEAQVAENTKAIAGTVVSNNNELVIACGNNTAIRLISVVPEGAKPMKAAQMLLGNPIAVGTKIGE